MCTGLVDITQSSVAAVVALGELLSGFVVVFNALSITFFFSFQQPCRSVQDRRRSSFLDSALTLLFKSFC